MTALKYEELIKEQFGEYLFNKYDIADLITGNYKEKELNSAKKHKQRTIESEPIK